MRRRYWIIGGIVLAIVLLAGGTQLYLFLNFLAGNDIIVRLSADRESLQLQTGEGAQVRIRGEVSANPFCSTQCTLSFDGSAENLTLRPGSGIERTFSITKDRPGSGQEIYRASMECAGVQTTLCHTDEKVTSRQLLITLDYELNDTERAWKDESAHLLGNVSAMLGIAAQQVLGNNTLDAALLALQERDEQARLVWDAQNFALLIDLSRALFDDVNQTAALIDERFAAEIERREEYNEALLQLAIQRNALASKTLALNQTHAELLQNRANLLLQLDERVFTMRNITRRINSTLSRIAQEENETAALLAQDANAWVSRVCEEEGACFENVSAASLANVCAGITSLNISAQESNVPGIARCTLHELNLTIPPLELAPRTIPAIEPVTPKELPAHPEQCCILGECMQCMPTSTNSTIIFLHGHAVNQDTAADYSLDAFNDIQALLERDGYLNAGAISLYSEQDVPAGTWGKSGVPLTIKASYYFDSFKAQEDYVAVQVKTENIDTYAIRLKDILDTVMQRTGDEQFIIVAHSMGGLVARRYVQLFGEEHVEKMILIAAPNHGISGRSAELCPILGGGLECRDMQEDSLLLNKLSREELPVIPITNIIGSGCDTGGEDGDGVVSVASARLDGARNVLVSGSCTRLAPLHSTILDPAAYPQTYQLLLSELRGQSLPQE